MSAARWRTLLLVAGLAMLTSPLPGGTVSPWQGEQLTPYVLGIYRRGPAWTAEKTPRLDSLQAGHLSNLGRMFAEGALVAAGPLARAGDLRGLLIFRADSTGAVRHLVARDPMLQARHLELDLHVWRASPGIGEPYRRMAAAPGFQDSMVTRQVVLYRESPALDRAGVLVRFHWLMLHSGYLRQWKDGFVGAIGPIAGGEGAATGLLTVGIFRGDSADVRRRIAADGAVEKGYLEVEQHTWWCAWGTLPGDTLR